MELFKIHKDSDFSNAVLSSGTQLLFFGYQNGENGDTNLRSISVNSSGTKEIKPIVDMQAISGMVDIKMDKNNPACTGILTVNGTEVFQHNYATLSGYRSDKTAEEAKADLAKISGFESKITSSCIVMANPNNYISTVYIRNGIKYSDGTDVEPRYYINLGGRNTNNSWFNVLIGNKNITNGCGCLVNGDECVANGTTSHAQGYSTTANGEVSHTEGSYSIANAQASHAEGHTTLTNGHGSHAEGYMTSALLSARYGHVEGTTNIVNGQASHAEGNHTVANGHSSHAEGYMTATYACNGNDVDPISEGGGGGGGGGGGTTIPPSGAFAHAEGYKTIAIGNASHSEGHSTLTRGEYSHAEGFMTSSLLSSNYSHAEGSNTFVSGLASHAEGYYSKTYNNYSHAEGQSSYAYGLASHAEGNQTHANGDYSHAEGNNTIASGTYQHVEGQYNVADNTKIHIIGGGTSDSNRINIHTLDLSGNAYFAGNLSADFDIRARGLFSNTIYTTGEASLNWGGVVNDFCISGDLYCNNTITARKIIEYPQQLETLGDGGMLQLGHRYLMTIPASTQYDVSAESLSAGYVGSAELYVDIKTGGSLVVGSNIIFENELTAGKINHCAINWFGVTARLFVVNTFDA